MSENHNPERLAEATARYFEQLDHQARAEENALAIDMMSAARAIDFNEKSDSTKGDQ